MAITSSSLKIYSDAACQNLVATFAGTTAASQTISVTGLTSDTTYYVKAEATNSDSLTGYSSVQSFTTAAASYVFVGTVSYSSAYNYLDVDLQVSCAGCTFTECGIEFSTNSNFTGNVIRASNTTPPANDFVDEVSGFSENTLYYYRYFADGTYGPQTSHVYSITTHYNQPTVVVGANNITDTAADYSISYTGNYPVTNLQLWIGTTGASVSTYRDIQIENMSGTQTGHIPYTLAPNTSYTLRGTYEYYGSTMAQIGTFTTLSATPVCVISTITDITPTSANIHLTIS